MFSKTLEMTLYNAYIQAKTNQHKFITLEHLLLALLDNPEVGDVLSQCGANVERLRATICIYINESTPTVRKTKTKEVIPTSSFQRVLQQCIFQAQITDVSEIGGVDLLVTLLDEVDSKASAFLNEENVTQEEVIQCVEGPSLMTDFGSSPTEKSNPSFDGFSVEDPAAEESELEKYAENLNKKAMLGNIDPIIGRAKELQRCIQVLSRRRKNNPIFVGEAGVGKTAIAEGLARLIVDEQVPDVLAKSVIFSLDLGSLLAGTKFRGDFEKRLKGVLAELQEIPHAVIFIDEIHNLVGAGATSNGSMDAANLIKPLLSSGELRCMGATTYDEYRNIFSKDTALLRRFQKIDVEETTPEQTIEIIQGLQPHFEKHHGLKYSDEAIQRAVHLSSHYLIDRFLPDKAIDVIDEVGSHCQLHVETDEHCVCLEDVDRVFSKMANIPLQQLQRSDQEMMKNLSTQLKASVFDQDEAIEALTDAIKISRAGLRDKTKPVGSFLFTGPTGVGKTEVTQQLAHEMGIDVLRFDMSEYMEKHSVARLIGTPPGYVGYEQGGLLTEALIKKPYSIVLFDEIEKAHPDIFNILLQVMDYGRLTDNNGRSADFRHAIIIMTSNAGATMLEKNVIGFSQGQQAPDSMGAIASTFPPEFRNRLDAIVQFKHLEKETVVKVVDKYMRELDSQLKEQDMVMEVSGAAIQWIAEQGYDRHMGARPIARLIDEKIKKPLADKILFTKRHGKVSIDVSDGEIRVVT